MYQSLHDAVRAGDINAVDYFLNMRRTDVNSVDKNGNTPLLITVCVEEEDIYNLIVSRLIDKGGNVNAYNKGLTPLYNSVFYKREESVKLLLKAGAWLRPSYKNELHLIAETGGSNILSLILNDERCTPEIINSRDDGGRTPLHLAAQFCHKNCLKMLIEHGGDLTAFDEDKVSVIEIIFEQFIRPELFIMGLLDDSIKMQQTEKYKWDYNIDFSILAPKRGERQMEVISNILIAASEEEKIEILQHPLIELYLILKWKRMCYFFYLWIIIYFIFAVSMGLYSNFVVHRVRKTIVTDIFKYLIILTSSGLLGHAVIQLILIRGNYLQRYEILMNLICTCLSLVVTIATYQVHDTTGSDKTSNREMPKWILHVTSIAILMAWIELMLLLGRLPSLGYYALMFSVVLQNIVKVLMAFLCLIFGFVLSFSIQFQDNEQFSDPWKALVKTVVMMMGEYEYGDLFAGAETQNATLSRIIFLIFILLASIVLVNLMVGVAVSDIQELRRLSCIKRLEKQAEFLCQLEKVISSKKLNSKYIPVMIRKIVVRRGLIDTNFKINTSTEFQRNENIPRKVIDSIISIRKERK